ncbi:hypothetical protein [Arthrobacter sp. Cr_A7]|uniref:hypothetical protein n=1 Tax=Arthrobacter sp. Cr_A7 TaxID=3031017 RepID=UPI0023DB1F2D|nr:hypothetical protein [Arthrobacter sp. Cr_A7]MDF2050843.1 hypothetical protein [Arthrobacter sp. Cr_A7]
MSAHGGAPARRGGLLFGVAVLAVALPGCEYAGPEDQPAPASPPVATPQPRSFEVQTNPYPTASELEDLAAWSAGQLQPRIPGELRGTNGGKTTSTGTLMAEPGEYELHFVCIGPTFAELSVSTSAGAEVLAPVRVPCDGQALKTPLLLPTQGADFTMSPDDGVDGRFAYRLVPTAEPTGAG